MYSRKQLKGAGISLAVFGVFLSICATVMTGEIDYVNYIAWVISGVGGGLAGWNS